MKVPPHPVQPEVCSLTVNRNALHAEQDGIAPTLQLADDKAGSINLKFL